MLAQFSMAAAAPQVQAQALRIAVNAEELQRVTDGNIRGLPNRYETPPTWLLPTTRIAGVPQGEVAKRVLARGIHAMIEKPIGLRIVAELLAEGTVETLTLAEAYQAAGPFLPETQLAFYDAATKREAEFKGKDVPRRTTGPMREATYWTATLPRPAGFMRCRSKSVGRVISTRVSPILTETSTTVSETVTFSAAM